jgi:hypothetical protein
MHRLIAPRFTDPRWVNIGQQEATIIDSQSVRSLDQIFHLADPSEISLQSSKKTFVYLSRQFRHFYLETEEEQQKQRRKIEERKTKEKQERQEQDKKLREDAIEFNASLNIPVEWAPGVKDVLSGYSENSWGDGHNSATVYHIFLKEDIHDGRFHRKKGNFLCSASSRDNGKNWSGQQEREWIDSNREIHRPKVTCKSCLRIATRWN